MNIKISLSKDPILRLFTTYFYKGVGELGLKPNSLKTLILKLICEESK